MRKVVFLLVLGLSAFFIMNASPLVNDCSFCHIITGTGSAVIIAEDADCIAIEKRPVRSPVDCLIIPKKHIVNCKNIDVNDAYDATIISKMVCMAQKLSKKLTGSQDFQLHINNGAQVGQSVFHLHMHFKSSEQWA